MLRICNLASRVIRSTRTVSGSDSFKTGCGSSPMPRRENPRVKKALDLLNEQEGVKAIKLHGSIYQERGNPDILACVRRENIGLPYTGYRPSVHGAMAVAEMKTENGKLSK